MSDQETLAQLEQLQHLTQDLIAQCESRLAQVTVIARDLEPILAAHSALTNLGDLESKLASLEALAHFDTSAIKGVVADAAQQTDALKVALAEASQWQIDLIAQKSELESLAATVNAQVERVTSTATEVQANLAASDQVSQSILERLDRLTLGSSEALELPSDLEQRLTSLEAAVPTTADWLSQVEASVQELQAFSDGLTSQRMALEALIAEGTAHLNGLLVRGQTQIAEVVGSQQEHLSALVSEASQRSEQAQTAASQLESQLPALQAATQQAEAVLAQLNPLGETIANQLAELSRLSSLELPALPDTTELTALLAQLASERDALTAQLQAQQKEIQLAIATEIPQAITSLKENTEAELSQSLFALSEAAISNVREALESLPLPSTPSANDTNEATDLLSQVTEVQERLFTQQQNFASQLEASVQVQTGLEAQMQQWQSLIESVDLNGLARRLEQLEQTATALNASEPTADPALLTSLSERLSQLEQQGETVSALQPTLDSLCDRTAELHSQLQALKEPATPDFTPQIAALEAHYQALAAQVQQANPTATDLAELDSLKAALSSLSERYSSLEQAMAVQMAAESATDLEALEAAYRLLDAKVTALEARPVAPTESTVSLEAFQALQAEHQALRDRYETLQSSQNTLIEATKALLKRVKALET